ncbi:MAG TPA: DUF192 domain-containing protein [Candidatus Aquilonibacter sp.]|nr:DUF192 domain-containing protein [Candidatus Aquilonibacter sp.]
MITELLYKLLSFRTKRVRIGRMSLNLWVASSTPQHILGLMHKPRIFQDQGMLFVFESDASHDIWMYNMNFAIDCIWIDRNGKVVEIINDMNPCGGMLDCPAYSPAEDSRYVLELKAGMAKKLKISKGANLGAIIR